MKIIESNFLTTFEILGCAFNCTEYIVKIIVSKDGVIIYEREHMLKENEKVTIPNDFKLTLE